MPAAKKKEFDVELFRKRVRHFDNPNVNERDVSILQALKQCEECELLFCDAVCTAFGAGGDDRDLRARLSEAETENARLQDENRKLRDGVQALHEELAEQQNAAVREREGWGFAGMMREAWSMAQVRLAVLVGAVALRLWLVLQWGNLAWWANILSVAAVLWAFVKWSGRQYEQSGLGGVALKLVVFGTGLWLALTAFFGGGSWLAWLRAPEFDGNAWSGFGMLACMFLVALSSLPERLVRLLRSSANPVFEALRWWFARPA
jgi:hypothetical protein